MNRRHGLVLACIALLFAACAATPPQPRGPDLSGDWVLTTESPVGMQDSQMTVRQTGTALAGTITGEGGSVSYTGSLNGSAVAFDFTIDVNGSALQLDYTGVVDGDTMNGKTVFGQLGEGVFTAKRK